MLKVEERIGDSAYKHKGMLSVKLQIVHCDRLNHPTSGSTRKWNTQHHGGDGRVADWQINMQVAQGGNLQLPYGEVEDNTMPSPEEDRLILELGGVARDPTPIPLEYLHKKHRSGNQRTKTD